MVTRKHRNNGFKQFYPTIKEYGNKFQNDSLLESLYDLFLLCGYNAVEMESVIRQEIERIKDQKRSNSISKITDA